MEAIKVKILSINTTVGSAVFDEMKPDKRTKNGYRNTGKKISKIVVNTTLVMSKHPRIRLAETIQVGTFGKMRVTSTCFDTMTARNLELTPQEHFVLNYTMNEYVDILPLMLSVGESSSDPKHRL